MLQATAAIADFMVILVTSALWGMGAVVGAILLGGAALFGVFFFGRSWWRRKRP